MLMKTVANILHTNRKKVLAALTIQIVVTCLFHFLLVFSIDEFAIQLDNVLHSKYLFSAVSEEVQLPNTYYRFDAGICFSNKTDAQTNINADIVMQNGKGEYTDLVYWNSGKLSKYGIAISENIAHKYHIREGDVLYSKHIVTGAMVEYTVEQIVPSTVYIRSEGTELFNIGVIIIGFDQEYYSYLKHDCLLYTEIPVEQIGEYAGGISDIVYREQEIRSCFRKILPFCLLYLSLCCVALIILANLQIKDIICNYKRLLMLGFEKKILVRTYFWVYVRNSIGAIILSVALSLATTSLFFEKTKVGWLLILSFGLVECIVVSLTALRLNRKVWSENE